MSHTSAFIIHPSIHPPTYHLLLHLLHVRMRPLVRLNFSSARNSLAKTISSLAPGHVLQGAQWDYRIVDAVKGDSTHASAVFRAKIVPRENTPNAPQ